MQKSTKFLKKRVALISGLVAMSTLMTGCSALKESLATSWKEEKGQSEMEAIDMISKKGSFEVHSLNEQLKLELTEPNNKSSFINYTIKNARLYHSLEETGIEKGELIRTEYYEDEIPIRVEPEEIDGMNVIVCDIEFQAIEENKEIHITDIDLVNEREDGKLYGMGSPIYFSHKMEERAQGSKYYHFITTKEPVVCKIAWPVRPEFAEKYKLYICTGYYQENEYSYLTPVEK